MDGGAAVVTRTPTQDHNTSTGVGVGVAPAWRTAAFRSPPPPASPAAAPPGSTAPRSPARRRTREEGKGYVRARHPSKNTHPSKQGPVPSTNHTAQPSDARHTLSRTHRFDDNVEHGLGAPQQQRQQGQPKHEQALWRRRRRHEEVEGCKRRLRSRRTSCPRSNSGHLCVYVRVRGMQGPLEGGGRLIDGVRKASSQARARA